MILRLSDYIAFFEVSFLTINYYLMDLDKITMLKKSP